LAGGQSLIPLMKLRFAAPAVVIDIGGIDGLAGVRHAAGRFTLGALTTHATLASDATLRERAPALADAARELGDPQVRNRGTAGGSCAHNDPAADYPAVMLALDASLALAGPGGRRNVAAADFFLPMFQTTLAAGELLTGIDFDDAPFSAYAKFHHPASGYAVVGAAAALRLRAGAIVDARIALTGAGFGAFRADAVEAALRGCAIDDAAALRAACVGAAAGQELRGDAFASAGYRAAMAGVYAERAVARALARSRMT
jgi:carbon-monoxide dehydrogenase medium subunit